MKSRIPVIRVLLHLSLGLLQAVGWLLLWLGLSAALLLAFERLGTQHYAPGDAPHQAFQVLALQADGRPALRFLRTLAPGTPLATQAPLTGREGDHFFRLQQAAPGVLELYADSDTFISTQRYRVEGGQVTPLSFRWRNVGHGFIAFIGAVPLLWLLKKLAQRLIKKDSKV